MIYLPEVLQTWNTPDFQQTFSAAIQGLDNTELPLQQALAQSSYVSNSPRTSVILHSSASDDFIRIKAGIFYFGIIAGSCCADDPSTLCEENEYCELQFDIDRITAATRVTLL